MDDPQQTPPPVWNGAPPGAGVTPPGPRPYRPAPVTPPPGPWGLLATAGWMGLLVVASIGSSIVSMLTYMAIFEWPQSFSDFQRIGQKLATEGDYVWLSEIFLALAIAVVLAPALLLRRGYSPLEYLAIKKFSARDFALFAGGLLVFIVLSDATLYLFDIHPVPVWMRQVYKSTGCLPCLLFAIVVLAPVLEEIVFRGFLFTSVAARLGAGWAIAAATVPWALLHSQYSWHYIIVGAILGVIFSVARIKTGSVILPIILHATCNLIAFLELLYVVHLG